MARMHVAAIVALVAAVALVDGRAASEQARRQQFACYPAQFTAFRARRVLIFDSVARLTAIVRRPSGVCVPAVVDGVKSALNTPYLTCYELSAPPGIRRNLVVSNAFGAGRVTVGSPPAMCLSAARTSKPPAALRLTCYRVLRPASDRDVAKTVGDTYGTTSDSVDVGRPTTFCTEATRGVIPPLQLMCYSLESQTLGRALVVTDEWGILRASLGRRAGLCIQSSARP